LALTRRGKTFVAGGATVAVLAAGVGALAFTGHANVLTDPIRRLVKKDPPTCPLIGTPLPGDKAPPARPALAVKVENTSEAQPLAGLDKADVVYEEVVEGGITRFIAVFNCGDAPRVGPVRSARSTDPKILLQFSPHPVLAFSGGAPKIVNDAKQAGLVEMVEGDPAAAFTRDSARAVPHNLFTNTHALYAAAAKRDKGEPAPTPAFQYGDIQKPNKKATSATVAFSSLATADWRWAKGHWVRYLNDAPMALEGGGPITATNVVIQQVKTTESNITDVAGYPSPEVTVTGTGKAWVLRNGKVIAGTWSRASEGDITTFLTKSGDQINLAPGRTFVELAPTGMFDAQVTIGS
jgi:hypothetical protein